MLMLKVINCVTDHIRMALMHVNIKGWTSGRDQGLRPRLVLLFSPPSFNSPGKLTLSAIPAHRLLAAPINFTTTTSWHLIGIPRKCEAERCGRFFFFLSFFSFFLFSQVLGEQIKYCYSTFLRMLQCICVCKNKTLQEYQCFQTAWYIFIWLYMPRLSRSSCHRFI